MYDRVLGEPMHNIRRTWSTREILDGKKLDLTYLKAFGSIAFVHIPREKRQTLDPKSEKCILVGYHLSKRGTTVSTLLPERFM